MTFSKSNTRPYRETETNFRAYEWLILKFTIDNGNALTIDPSPLAATTFSARLRDAIAMVLKNPEWQTEINRASLREVWRNATVTHDGVTVRIGPRIKRAQQKLGVALPPSHDPTLQADIIATVSNPDRATAEAFVKLLSKGYLKGTVIIKNLNEDIRKFLEECEVSEEFDIALADHGDSLLIF